MKKQNLVIISVIVGILSFLFAVFIVMMVFGVIKNSDSGEVMNETTLEEEPSEDNNLVFKDYPDDYNTEPTTVADVIPTNVNNSAPDQSGVSDLILIDDSIYIVSNTPGGAGVVMRSSATSSSEKIGVLPEGSRVYVYSDDSSNNTGYVKVRTMDEIADRNCYVLKKYLRFECLFSSVSDNSGNNNSGNYYYVSYSTPNHVGINLRSEPSSTSELICLISEGEELKLIGGFNSQVNGYVKVAYDHPHAGEVYEGWVLATYLTS